MSTKYFILRFPIAQFILQIFVVAHRLPVLDDFGDAVSDRLGENWWHRVGKLLLFPI